MDCIDFLRLQRDNSVNLAVIDPPYNMQKAKWDKFDSHTEFLHFTYSWIDELISKINKNGSIYIFNTPFNCAYILQYLVTKGLVFQNWITIRNLNQRKYTCLLINKQKYQEVLNKC